MSRKENPAPRANAGSRADSKSLSPSFPSTSPIASPELTAQRPVLGIDPGAGGAIAVLSAEGGLLQVHDMPTLADGPSRRRNVNAALLAELAFKSHAAIAYVEFVSTRPGEGAVGAFAFGRSRGVIEGVLAAAGVPVAFLAPSNWKRAVGIPPGADRKDAARAEAIRRWPGQAGLFARVRDDGRAEAALIAVAGLAKAARR